MKCKHYYVVIIHFLEKDLLECIYCKKHKRVTRDSIDEFIIEEKQRSIL
jgi:hypothetical protein